MSANVSWHQDEQQHQHSNAHNTHLHLKKCLLISGYVKSSEKHVNSGCLRGMFVSLKGHPASNLGHRMKTCPELAQNWPIIALRFDGTSDDPNKEWEQEKLSLNYKRMLN